MYKQAGFGVVPLFLIVLIFAFIGGEGWLLYHRSQLKVSTASTYTYHYSPVPVDTSQWVSFQPFQGFSIKIPTPPDWHVADSGNFGPQAVGGTITDPQHQPFILHKTTTLFTSDANPQTFGDLKKGARITLNVIYRDATYKSLGYNTQQEPPYPCKYALLYWRQDQVESLPMPHFTVCQIKLADNQYDFKLFTEKYDYTTELVWGPHTSSYLKNYYLSLTRAFIGTYQPV